MSDQIKHVGRTKLLELPDHESKLDYLATAFRKHMPNYGDVLRPADGFYFNVQEGDGLRTLAAIIFNWLGVNAKNLVIDYHDIEPPGLYFEDDNQHFILIKTEYRENPFQCAAILAHEIMHYVLLGKFKVRLEETLENEQLTDLATIQAGLGVLVMNGFEYDSGWAATTIGLMFGRISDNRTSLSFGYYKPQEYGNLLQESATSMNLDEYSFAGYFLPWMRHFLPPSMSSAAKLTTQKPGYVDDSQKRVRKATLKQVLIVIVFIPFALVFWGWRTGAFNSTKSSSDFTSEQNQQLDAQKAQIDTMQRQLDTCDADVDSKRATLDHYNSAAVDSFNSEVDSCNSTRAQLKSQVDSYNAAIAK